MNEKPYLVLAYYHFVPLPDCHEEVLRHKAFFEHRDVTCRVYISEKGINGQMSASRDAAKEYIEWMHSRNQFSKVIFKIHEADEQVFPRKTVKYRPQLVALDEEVNLELAGEHLSPEEWKKKLEAEKDHVLIDVRNEYEWKIGHFEGADLPPCDNFREFREYADKLKETKDPKKTPVMMYCTGGIRCELYSAVLKEKGFENVYQLDGGIINYGLKLGNDHWLGKLFVFDDRLAVSLSEENKTVIGKCEICEKPNDTYYNCANMDCNKLFLCCPDCVKQFKGCCQESCMQGKRVRPYNQVNHKPFRKKHCYVNPKK